jgi:peptidoglycan LD-endopeptidase LytH
MPDLNSSPSVAYVSRSAARRRRRAVLLGALLLLTLALSSGYLVEAASLEVPVVGVHPAELVSTWHAPRSGGRQHQGVDIFAARGTSVRASTSGRVLRVGVDSLGGNVVWVLGPGPALYYYAHLDAWSPGLSVGQGVRAGEVLGTVGNTGNARTTPPHLHFGIYRLGWSGARAVDPVELLKERAAKPPAQAVLGDF